MYLLQENGYKILQEDGFGILLEPPVIIPGAAVASDGLYSDKVALSLSGTSISSYGTLIFQWQKSAADSDALYSDIPGATAATYNDTAAPNNGEGRYYRCVLNADGAIQQITTVNRGFRAHYLKPRNVTTLIVRNSSGQALSYIPQSWGIHPTYRVNELPGLEFIVPGNSAARSYFVDPNEVYQYKDGVLKDIFRVCAPEKSRSRSTDITVSCLGIGYALKKSAVVSYSVTATATAHITALLALQETAIFTIGTVDPVLNITFALAVSKTDIWLALKEILKVTGGYLVEAFDAAAPSTRTVSLKASIGESKGQQIRVNKNLLSVKHRTDYMELFNKLYCYGNSGAVLTSKTYTKVTATKSQDATYGYLTLAELYAAYKDWTAAGASAPVNVTVYKPGGNWISPTSYTNDPAVGALPWYLPAQAYDGNTGTAATAYGNFAGQGVPASSWSSYLILNHAVITTTQIRVWLGDSQGAASAQLDIYYGGAWHTVWNSPYPVASGWYTIPFASVSITSIRLRFYNYSTLENFMRAYEVQIWDATSLTDDTAHWKQGADERMLRCAIADYDATAPYVLSYTQAAYLIDLAGIAGDRTKIYSKTHDFDTADVDTLLAQGQVYLTGTKTPSVSVSGEYIDLSVEEGRSFEEHQLGNTVSVIDGDLLIGESVPIVKLEHPDAGNHPDKISSEFGQPTKTLIDSMKELGG